jgi:hypothetical protein
MGRGKVLGHSAGGALILGNDEFGEVYHAALAMIYDPNLHIEIEAGRRQQIFWSFLDAVIQATYQYDARTYSNIDRVHLGKQVTGKVADDRKISKTTKVITRHARVDPAPVIFTLQRLMVRVYDGWIANKLGSDGAAGAKKILVWIRNDANNEPIRNTTPERLRAFAGIATDLGCQPIYVGAQPGFPLPGRATHLVEFYNDFPGNDTVLDQLAMFKVLRDKFNVVAQIGMQSGGMDGPAFFVSIPTASLVFHSKFQRTPRLSQVGGLSHYHTFPWSDTANRPVPQGGGEIFRTFDAQIAQIGAALQKYTV